MVKIRTLIIISFLIFYSPLKSQNRERINQLMNKYEGMHSVVMADQEELFIDLDKDSIAVSYHGNRQMLGLTNYASSYSYDEVRLTGFSRLNSIQASTLVPTKSGYKSYVVTDFKEVSELGRNIFYDDNKVVQFNYPALGKGTIATLDYHLSYSDFHFLPTIYFQNSLPTHEKVVRIKVHRAIEVGYRLFNDSLFNIKFAISTHGKYKIYEWRIKNVEAYSSSLTYSQWLSTVPYLLVYVDGVKKRKLKDEYCLGTLDELYQFYHQFTTNVDNESVAELTQLSEKLTTNCFNDIDKAQAIVNWVRGNIKYIAFEQGVRGFTPHSGAQVFKNRYGDCKDMSSLIYTMLRSIGVKSHLGWIGTRSIPYSITEVPFLNATNHMVAVLPVDSVYYLLDGTFPSGNIAVSPYHLQGKEVLIGKSASEYALHTVPKAPLGYSSVIDSSHIKIDEGIIIGNVKRAYTGFKKMEVDRKIDHTAKSTVIESVQNLYLKGNNKFKVLNADLVENKHDSESTTILFNFELKNYATEIDSFIYLNFNLEKPLLADYLDVDKIIFPIENDYCMTLKYVTSLTIPDGYEVTYMPENMQYNHEKFNVKVNYTKKEKSVRQEKIIELNFLKLENSETVYDWNTMVQNLTRSYQNTVVLKKRGGN